jgi:hypothetical protein
MPRDNEGRQAVQSVRLLGFNSMRVARRPRSSRQAADVPLRRLRVATPSRWRTVSLAGPANASDDCEGGHAHTATPRAVPQHPRLDGGVGARDAATPCPTLGTARSRAATAEATLQSLTFSAATGSPRGGDRTLENLMPAKLRPRSNLRDNSQSRAAVRAGTMTPTRRSK